MIFMRAAITSQSGYPSVLAALLVLSTVGCGSAGRTIGVGLAGTGLAAVGTGAVLAVGCSTPNPENPALEQRGQPCLPAETYETYKPAIITGITLGLIMVGAGIAIYSVSDPPPAPSRPPPRPPPPPSESVESAPPKEPCTVHCD